MEIRTVMNVNDFLFASIHEVVKTLIEAFVLVFLVVFLFLQDLRSTLIPTIAIPVALIGTFFALYIIGFSINLLTLRPSFWPLPSWSTTPLSWWKVCTPNLTWVTPRRAKPLSMR